MLGIEPEIVLAHELGHGVPGVEHGRGRRPGLAMGPWRSWATAHSVARTAVTVGAGPC